MSETTSPWKSLEGMLDDAELDEHWAPETTANMDAYLANIVDGTKYVAQDVVIVGFGTTRRNVRVGTTKGSVGEVGDVFITDRGVTEEARYPELYRKLTWDLASDPISQLATPDLRSVIHDGSFYEMIAGFEEPELIDLGGSEGERRVLVMYSKEA